MRFVFLIACFFCAQNMVAQISLGKLKNAANKAQAVINHSELSENEVNKGLKEALIIGVTNSLGKASKEGGFNNNLVIKIPFPEDAQKMKNTLIKVGMKSQVDRFEYVLNEAAEDASNFAKDIFVNVVKEMTINDAMSILKRGDDSATIYLRSKTTASLYIKFKPIVARSIKKVDLTKYWAVLTARYNSLPLTKEINADLEDYVVNKAIDGLFILIKQEENNIRNNPEARVSEILQRVFR